MATLTIHLSDDEAAQLRAMAEASQVGSEHLASDAIRDWLRQRQVEYLRAAEQVLKKNAELYRRLA